MKKLMLTLLLILPLVFFSSCGSDDDDIDNTSGIKATYRVYSSIPEKIELMISYNDSQGNYIVKTVDSGWTLDVDLPKGTKAFIAAVAWVKEDYKGEDLQREYAIVQILQNGAIKKEAQGEVCSVEIVP